MYESHASVTPSIRAPAVRPCGISGLAAAVVSAITAHLAHERRNRRRKRRRRARGRAVVGERVVPWRQRDALTFLISSISSGSAFSQVVTTP